MTSLLIYQRVGNPKGQALDPEGGFSLGCSFLPLGCSGTREAKSGFLGFYINKQTNKQKYSQLDAAGESLTIVPHGAPN